MWASAARGKYELPREGVRVFVRELPLDIQEQTWHGSTLDEKDDYRRDESSHVRLVENYFILQRQKLISRNDRNNYTDELEKADT